MARALSGFAAARSPAVFGLATALHPRTKKVEQRQLHWPVSGKAKIRDAEFLARGPGRRHMDLHLSLILLARHRRIDVEIAARFDIVKHRGIVEVEGKFRRIEHVEQHDLVARSRERNQIFFERIDWRACQQDLSLGIETKVPRGACRSLMSAMTTRELKIAVQRPGR